MTEQETRKLAREQARKTWHRLKRMLLVAGMDSLVRRFGPEILGILAADYEALMQERFTAGYSAGHDDQMKARIRDAKECEAKHGRTR